MRKILILLAVTMFAATYARAEEFRFNGFAWGTPKSTIAAAENSPNLRWEAENRANFTTVNIFGQNADGIYLFTKDALLGGAGYSWRPNPRPRTCCRNMSA